MEKNMEPHGKFPLMKSARRAPVLTLLVLLITVHLGSASVGAAADTVTAYETEKVVPFEFDGDLRDLPQFPLNRAAARRPYRPLLTPPPKAKLGAPAKEPDFSEAFTPLAPMPSPIQSFAGLNSSDLCGGVQCGAGWPPDINGDVGLNHYIVTVNDAYGIYSKTGTLLTSFTEDQLWSGGGANPCNGDSAGDPVVLYDQLADRWILTHFAFAFDVFGNPISPFYQCIAASKTSDPVSGGWWLFPVRMDPGGAGLPPVGALNDYGKFGIWTDCLYGAFNEFQAPSFNFAGTAFASFSRSDLYSGAPLTMALGVLNSSGPFTMIPSNLSGRSATALPAGTPNYFVSESQTIFAFEVRKFTAGPNCGGGGTLGAAANVSQTSYTPVFGTVVPQPGTTNLLDSLGDRLMQKVQYRKLDTAESVWVVHSVQVGSSASTVRPQWAQIDVTGGVVAATPVQQQIYAPDTTLYRWMPSLAVDNQGNMALGYSTSNGTAPNFPSIAYSGRLATDPLNTLPQTEVQLIAGAGSQTNNCGGAPCHRWGDYTAMSVDPVDDCTFWYTNEYYSSTTNGATGNWQTRVGSFKFPSCAQMDTIVTSGPTAASGEATNSTTAIFSFTSTDSTATFECSLDTAAFAACTSPKTYTKLKVGPHNFQVQATVGGVPDPTPASFDWTIDTKAPNTAITSAPGPLTNNPVATFTFTSTEAGGTFQCSVDGAPFAPCTSPFTTDPLGDGKHAFQVRGIDAAGNPDKSAAKAKAWTVDTTLPVTNITGKPTDPTTSTSATFKFKSEKKSTFMCKLDAGAFEACKSGKKYSGLLPGPHNFQVQATDAALNVELTPVSFDWTIIP
jgi:hypothetical protein